MAAARARTPGAALEEPADEHINEVRLVGRVSGDPVERTLPSGDLLVTWRLVVRRAPEPRNESGRAAHPSDVINCSAWTARLRRSALTWRDGDVVDLTGALRRRFWKAGGAIPASRTEVEVEQARRVARA